MTTVPLKPEARLVPIRNRVNVLTCGEDPPALAAAGGSPGVRARKKLRGSRPTSELDLYLGARGGHQSASRHVLTVPVISFETTGAALPVGLSCRRRTGRSRGRCRGRAQPRSRGVEVLHELGADGSVTS